MLSSSSFTISVLSKPSPNEITDIKHIVGERVIDIPRTLSPPSDSSFSISVLPSSKETEIKHIASELITDTTIASTPAKQYYTRGITAERLEKLKEYYKKQPEDFEKCCEEHPIIYWIRFSEYTGALAINGVYIFYLIKLGNEGIDSFTYTLFSTYLPRAAAYSISIPLATLGGLLFAFTFLPGAAAAESTIYLAHLPTIIYNHFAKFKDEPRQALTDTLMYVGDKFILTSTNIVYNIMYVIGLQTLCETDNLPIGWTALMLFLGESYWRGYANSEYYAGIDFWANKKYPSLFKLITQGELTIPLYVISQSIGSVILPAFPVGYGLAPLVENALGGWLSPTETALLMLIRSAFIFYPGIYDRHLGYRIKIDDLLEEKENEVIKLQALALLQTSGILSNPDISRDEINAKYIEIRKTIIRERRNELIASVAQHHSYLDLFRDAPSVILPLILQSTFGGYLGYTLLAASSPGYMALGIIGGTALFFAFHKRAANLCWLEKKTYEYLASTMPNYRPAISMQKPKCSSTSFIAAALNIGEVGSTAIANIGIAGEVLGLNNNSPAIPAVSYIAFTEAIITRHFNQPKVLSTVETIRDVVVKPIYASVSRCFSSCYNSVSSWCSYFKSAPPSAPATTELQRAPTPKINR